MTAGRDAVAVKVGPGRLWLAPLGTTEPTTLTGALDAGFLDVGYTEQGTTFTFGTQTADIDVAEEFYPVDTVVTGKSVQLALTAAQDTAQNLYYAVNGGTITSVGGAWQVDPPVVGAEVKFMAVWEDGVSAALNKRRFLFRKVTQSGDAAQAHQKN